MKLSRRAASGHRAVSAVLTSAKLRNAVALVGLATAAAPALAADVYWDGDGVGPVAGGAGTWDATTPRFSASPTGSTYSPINPADNAVFGAPGSTVLVTGPVTAAALTFTSPGYTLLGPGPISTAAINTGAFDVELFPALVGTAGLLKTGTGALVFHGSNTFTGPVSIAAGTLALGNTAVANIPNSSPVGIASGATFSLGYTGGAFNDTIGTLGGAGNVVLGSLGYAGMLTNSGSQLSVGADNGSGLFSGSINGTNGRVVKTGTGTQTFSGTNTFGQSLGVAQGTLVLSGGNAVGDTAAVFISSVTSGANPTLGVTANETIGALGAAGTGSAVTLSNGATLTVGAANLPNIQYQGAITGTGSIVKVGSGIQQLTQTNGSNFVGSVTIREGTLLASKDSVLGNAANPIVLDGGYLANFPGTAATYGPSQTTGRSITVNGGGVTVLQNGVTKVTNVISGNVGGTGALTKTGPGVLQFAGSGASNNWSGGLIVTEGGVLTSRGIGTPFGTGSIDLRTGELTVQPGGGAGTAVVNLASGDGATFTYGPGSQLFLNKGPSNNTILTVNIGSAGATNVWNPRVGSTMAVLAVNGGTLMGQTGGEGVKVAGDIPVRNGIVSPSIVAWQNFNTPPGDFMTYNGTRGLYVDAAVYTGGDLNVVGAPGTAAPAAVYLGTTPQVLTADAAVYAANLQATVDGNHALTIGDGTGAAGLIMATGASIGATTPGTLVFSGEYASVYTQTGALGVIGSSFAVTGTGGITKFGYGDLTLRAAGSYLGATRVGQGGIVLGVDNAVPAATSLELYGSNANNLATAPSFRVGAFSQEVASLSGPSSIARVDVGTGLLHVNQNVDTTYAGFVTGTSGLLQKSGDGTLMFSNAFIASNYQRLTVSGGTLAVASLNNLPRQASGAFRADAITLENGATLRVNSYLTPTTTLTSLDTGDQASGLTLGTGGGVIDVTNPYEVYILQGVGVGAGNVRNAVVHDIAGSGDLTKAGPGVLRLYANAAAVVSVGGSAAPVTNSYTGKTKVLGGALQFPEDGALGVAPATLVEDQLQVANGAALTSLGAGNTIAATRGLSVGSGGAVLNVDNGSFTFDGPIGGTGGVTVIGTNSVTLNAASTFSGGLTLTNGSTFFNATGAAGAGAVTVTPQFPTVFGKSGGVGDTVLANAVQLNGGSTIGVRVDAVSGTASVGNLVMNGVVSGSANFTKTGDGTLVLANAANDFTGTLVVSGGRVRAGAEGALGPVTAPIVVNGGALQLTGSYVSPKPLVLNGAGVGGTGALENLSGDNTYAGKVTVGGGSVGVTSGSLKLGAVDGVSPLAKVGAGRLTVDRLRVGALSVDAGTLAVTPAGNGGGTSVVTGVSLAGAAGSFPGAPGTAPGTTRVNFVPTSTFDLEDNSLVVDYTGASTIDSVRQLITAAALGSSGVDEDVKWTGAGITSSAAMRLANRQAIGPATALGFGEASTYTTRTGATTFEGVDVDGSAVLVAYTYSGDANLDGVVNDADVDILAANYQDSAAPGQYATFFTDRLWDQGDFTYDGVVNDRDIDRLVATIGQGPAFTITSAGLAKLYALQAGGAAVPEPTGAAVVVAAVGAMAMRRRRRA